MPRLIDVEHFLEEVDRLHSRVQKLQTHPGAEGLPNVGQYVGWALAALVDLNEYVTARRLPDAVAEEGVDHG